MLGSAGGLGQGRGHLEANMVAALALQSPQEFRRWLTNYACHLAGQNLLVPPGYLPTATLTEASLARLARLTLSWFARRWLCNYMTAASSVRVHIVRTCDTESSRCYGVNKGQHMPLTESKNVALYR